ncbi:MAG: aminotransferase class V-fold PLP-dependent enzyme [Hyphomicrobiaceae bacterium]
MRVSLPVTGRPKDQILAEMREMKTKDIDWQHGRAPLFVFKATDELYEMGRDAYFEFFTENALGAKRAFHSVNRMQDDVVAMALGLFNAPDAAQGFMTTGGTESIIQAMQACRDWSRKQRKEPGLRGNIVAAETVHPAFDKGGKLMDIEVRRAPVGNDFRADPAAMEPLIDDQTIMLVGSAPCFPFGVIDPIVEIGKLAERRGLWLHVDACVGGYLAPFARMIGRDIPDFDFTVPAVNSISADLHKFGFCPKPASTVFYRSSELAEFHHFDFSNWPNGRFMTSTIVGTRPAGGVAAAWAAFQFLGQEGYKQIARDLMGFIDSYKAGISEIDGLKIHGRPHLSIVAYGSDEFDVFRVAEIMSAKGWLPGLVQKPKGIHRMMSMIHAPSRDEYLADVRAAVGVVRQAGSAEATIKATY